MHKIHDFSDLAPNLAPFSRQISPKTPPRCLHDALGRPSLVPKTAQEPPKRRPKCAKNRPRAAPEASRKRPTVALEPKNATKHPQTPSRPRFWTILATIWKDFGVTLDGFWKDFQTNWIHTLETIRWPCWGGCALPDPPPA